MNKLVILIVCFIVLIVLLVLTYYVLNPPPHSIVTSRASSSSAICKGEAYGMCTAASYNSGKLYLTIEQISKSTWHNVTFRLESDSGAETSNGTIQTSSGPTAELPALANYTFVNITFPVTGISINSSNPGVVFGYSTGMVVGSGGPSMPINGEYGIIVADASWKNTS
jgi:hypothetical protein